MAEVYKEVPAEDTTTTTPTAAPATTTAAPAATDDSAVVNDRKEHRINVAERIVYLLGGILLALLGLRFVLRLLGANPANDFANFVYTVTHPFVAPFFGLFNYDEQLNTGGHFEFETLIAIAVYALVMWMLGRLVSITSRRER